MFDAPRSGAVAPIPGPSLRLSTRRVLAMFEFRLARQSRICRRYCSGEREANARTPARAKAPPTHNRPPSAPDWCGLILENQPDFQGRACRAPNWPALVPPYRIQFYCSRFDTHPRIARAPGRPAHNTFNNLIGRCRRPPANPESSRQQGSNNVMIPALHVTL